MASHLGMRYPEIAMKRQTVADVAQPAGVSVSTVNRLLHGGATVRSETVERIVEAAERIGFYGLGTLRERSKPHRNLGFLMQQSHRPLHQLWAAQIVAAASRRTDTAIKANVLFEDHLAPEAVATNLLNLGKQSDAVAIIAADHPLVSQTIDELQATRVPVVAYITDFSAASRAGFVGTDNWKVGRTAAWFIRQMVNEPGQGISRDRQPPLSVPGYFRREFPLLHARARLGLRHQGHITDS
ncbi:LacI family DNA-binding transcriptional regulator [Bradyrhizobium sp. UFLA05-109]